MTSGCCSPAVTTMTHESSQGPITQGGLSTPNISRMIKIPSGRFAMGTNSALAYPVDGEGPKRIVLLDEYWIDETAVTNLDFELFIDATGYKTEAELTGWSFVPRNLLAEIDNKSCVGQSADTPWWVGINGADWRHPLGPSTSISDLQDHPVVHISWDDANAFAQWSGKRLPTEAEWEKAARGGNENTLYPWGDDLLVDDQFACNIWQGDFPEVNSAEDGYLGTAPVYAFQPNGYGLYNVCGNVWEWCLDWWSDNSHYRNHNGEKISNPLGPISGDSKVIKGGSFLCHDSYCNRYRISARTSHPQSGYTAHIGFRCVANKKTELLGSQ